MNYTSVARWRGQMRRRHAGGRPQAHKRTTRVPKGCKEVHGRAKKLDEEESFVANGCADVRGSV